MRRGIAGYIPLLLMCVIVAAFLAIVAEERAHLVREAMQVQRMIEESSMSVNASLSNGVLEIRGEPGQSMDLLYVIPLRVCGHHMCVEHIHRVCRRIDPGTVVRVPVGRPNAVCFATKSLDLVCVRPSREGGNSVGKQLQSIERSIKTVSREVTQIEHEVREVVKNVTLLRQEIVKEMQEVSLANTMLALITRTDPDLYFSIASRYIVENFEKVVIDPRYTKLVVFASASVYRVRKVGWYIDAWTRYRMFVALPRSLGVDLYLIVNNPDYAARSMKVLAQIRGEAVLPIGKDNQLLLKKSSGGSIVVYRGDHFSIVAKVSESIGLGTFLSYATPGGSLTVPTEVSYELEIVPDPGYYVAVFIPTTEFAKLGTSHFGSYLAILLVCFPDESCISPYGGLENFNVFKVRTPSMKRVGEYLYVVTDRPLVLVSVLYRNGGFYCLDAGPYRWPVKQGAHGAYTYIIDAPGKSISLYVFTLQKR